MLGAQKKATRSGVACKVPEGTSLDSVEAAPFFWACRPILVHGDSVEMNCKSSHVQLESPVRGNLKIYCSVRSH